MTLLAFTYFFTRFWRFRPFWPSSPLTTGWPHVNVWYTIAWSIKFWAKWPFKNLKLTHFWPNHDTFCILSNFFTRVKLTLFTLFFLLSYDLVSLWWVCGESLVSLWWVFGESLVSLWWVFGESLGSLWEDTFSTFLKLPTVLAIPEKIVLNYPTMN